MAYSAQAIFLAQSGQRLSPVLVMFILVVVIILVLWLALRWMGELNLKKAAPVEKARRGAEVYGSAAPAAAVADDLKIIEGIGPKIAAVLNAAGVTRFEQLAAMAPEEITRLLHDGGIRLADPRSWPQQARLAADGKLVELKALQASLLAGRQVS